MKLEEILNLHEEECKRQERRELERERKFAAVLFVVVVSFYIAWTLWSK